MPIRFVRLLAAVVFAATAAPASAQTFVFHLSGDQEVPPVASTSSGGCHGELNQVASEFTLHCSHDVVGATVMHIHRAPAGVNGAVAFDLGDPSSPVVGTWTGMTPADIADLLAGNLYVNIHTAGRPAGEIRGQILPRTVDSFAFGLDGGQQVPPDETEASGNCTADLDAAATVLSVQCTHDVAQPTDAHIHNAPFGVNGPVIFTFPSSASPLSGDAPLTPTQVAEFAAGFLYVNVHSVESVTGEIRGQIALPQGTGPVVIATKGSTTSVVPETGAAVSYTFTVENAGGAGFTITSLDDVPFGPLTGDADCQVGTVLAAGASCDFAATFDVPAGGLGETFVNTFTVAAIDAGSTTGSGADDHAVTYSGVAPAVSVSKQSATVEVPAGGATVTYSFTVTNTGSVAFTIDALDDVPFGALAGDADCQVGTALEPGSMCSFDAAFAVPAGAAGTGFVNTFTAIVSDIDSSIASSSDAHVVTYLAGGPNVPPPLASPRPIPSGSVYGLALLMLALGGAGWLTLRRSV